MCRTGPNAGKRSYAARGYFAANAERPNLHVLCEALVSSVQLDGNKATGANFVHEGKTHTVKAGREVIISGGAIQSPQILELSGIGDPAVLSAAGVECKVENKAVGANFQDHSLTVSQLPSSDPRSDPLLTTSKAVSWALATGNPSFEVVHQPEVMAAAQQELMEKQTGPLTHIASTQGFFPYKVASFMEICCSRLTFDSCSPPKPSRPTLSSRLKTAFPISLRFSRSSTSSPSTR